MSTIRGDKTLSGTWGEVWVDGDKIFECSKIEQKITANREDVQLGIDVDSKIVGLKGEFTLTVKRVYTRYNDIFNSWKKGLDQRVQIICKLEDPDSVGGQIERYATNNCWFNDLPLVSYEKGSAIEQEVTGGFTPTDMQLLDEISY
ncbi:MAG: phage tail tube protein [bacterium]